MDLELKGKVALVTGGSRGIGRATALRFGSEGCRVAICARGEEGLHKTLGDLKALGVLVFGVVADLSIAGEAARFVDEAAEALGGVDMLVNNVGGSTNSTFAEASDDDWVKTFDLNLFHSVRATRASLPYFRKRGGGSVVTIASISGWRPAPEKVIYGATKAAEIFLSSSLAWELSAQNVRVNTVSPGSIDFPGGTWERFRNQNPQDYAAFVNREFPAGRLGKAGEVADVIVFLSSPKANWINGAHIPVDGAQGRPTVF